MNEPLLEARGLTKSYLSGPRSIDVLADLDLTIRSGEAISVIGDSGVGKSTLLHLLGALDRPDRGTVLFRGRDVFAEGLAERARHRNDCIGFVFQFHHLLPEFTALENVAMPLRIARRRGDGTGTARALLESVGLGGRLHHLPAELSGGEQQRVAIARALAASPAVVLADEPTGNLDPRTGTEVFRALRQLQSERGFALVLATHSERLALGCDRILRLASGRLRALDPAERDRYFKGLGEGATSEPIL